MYVYASIYNLHLIFIHHHLNLPTVTTHRYGNLLYSITSGRLFSILCVRFLCSCAHKHSSKLYLCIYWIDLTLTKILWIYTFFHLFKTFVYKYIINMSCVYWIYILLKENSCIMVRRTKRIFRPINCAEDNLSHYMYNK